MVIVTNGGGKGDSITSASGMKQSQKQGGMVYRIVHGWMDECRERYG